MSKESYDNLVSLARGELTIIAANEDNVPELSKPGTREWLQACINLLQLEIDLNREAIQLLDQNLIERVQKFIRKYDRPIFRDLLNGHNGEIGDSRQLEAIELARRLIRVRIQSRSQEE